MRTAEKHRHSHHSQAMLYVSLLSSFPQDIPYSSDATTTLHMKGKANRKWFVVHLGDHTPEEDSKVSSAFQRNLQCSEFELECSWEGRSPQSSGLLSKERK